MSISSESNSIPRRYLIIKSYVYELTFFMLCLIDFYTMTQRNMFRELQLKIYDFVYCDTVIQPSPLVDGPPGGGGGGGGVGGGWGGGGANVSAFCTPQGRAKVVSK